MERHLLIKNYIRTLGFICPVNLLSEKDQDRIVYCLTHQEEKDNKNRDEWGNWEHVYTVNDFSAPYLDRHISEVLTEAGVKRNNIWPEGNDFAFCLTHDLDVISESDFIQLNRRYRRLFQYATSVKEKARLLPYIVYTRIKSILNPVRNDSLWFYEKWSDVEKSYGFTSTYFVYVAEQNLHYFDCDIMPSDEMQYRGKKIKLSAYIRLLKEEGFEIGLHGSYLTFDNLNFFREQKKRLESITGTPVICTRQHFLHYEIHKTPSIHKDAGINIDSTLGFNTNVGFRAGTSMPYFLAENLIEIPQIMMDGALFNENSLHLNQEQANQKIIEIIDMVEAVNGCLTINFHPNYLNREIWWNSYLFLLSELKRRKAWCGSMEEIFKLVNEVCAE